MAAAIVAVPTPTTAETRMPARIEGSASGSSIEQQALTARQAHRGGGLDQARRDARQTRGRGLKNRQDAVEDQGHECRAGADAADERKREEEAEEREAGDGLDDARDGDERAADARPPRRDDAERDAHGDGDNERDRDERDVTRQHADQFGRVRAPEVDQRHHSARPLTAALSASGRRGAIPSPRLRRRG